MKKLIFIITFFFVSIISFGQIYHAPIDTTEFCNIDTIHVTSRVKYSHNLSYNMDYEGEGIVTCNDAKEVEMLSKIIVDTLRYNADKSLVYLYTDSNNRPHIFKVYNKYNKIVLEQILPINQEGIIMYDRRYGNRVILLGY